MRTVSLVCILALVVAPVLAMQREGNVITLTDDEMKACAEGEGCVMGPKKAVRELMEQAYERGRVAGVRECKDRT